MLSLRTSHCNTANWFTYPAIYTLLSVPSKNFITSFTISILRLRKLVTYIYIYIYTMLPFSCAIFVVAWCAAFARRIQFQFAQRTYVAYPFWWCTRNLQNTIHLADNNPIRATRRRCVCVFMCWFCFTWEAVRNLRQHIQSAKMLRCYLLRSFKRTNRVSIWLKQIHTLIHTQTLISFVALWSRCGCGARSRRIKNMC